MVSMVGMVSVVSMDIVQVATAGESLPLAPST